MIDLATGNLLLADDKNTIGQDTTQQLFLTSFGTGAKPLVINPPWRSWAIQTSLADGSNCTMALYFYEHWLQQIHLWLEEVQSTNKLLQFQTNQEARHRQWLNGYNVTIAKPYSWGLISLNEDVKNPGEFPIIITYRKHAKPPISHLF